MNDYPEIISAMDKFLGQRKRRTETRQAVAFVVALAHRVEKDLRHSSSNGRARPKR